MDSQLDAASVADATTAKMAHCQLGFEIERLPDAGPPAIGAYWTVVNPPELKVLDGGVTRLALSSIARLIS
ncbi:MAG TPA: hypothetical protein VFX59_01245 [Polyangiales bacterium]|nr:hypothetical protein [Polyangiales bacterium]